ncbi:hypothetical protein D3C75_959000 [compost metagenome]
MRHSLDIAESGRTCRLHLPFRDSHNSRTDRFCNKCRGVHGKTYRSCLEAIERKTQCRRAVIENIHNEQQRNITDELDVSRSEPAQCLNRGDSEHRDYRAEQKAADQGQHAGQDRAPEALQIKAEIIG